MTDKLKFKPTNGRIFVRPLYEDNQDKSKIIKPDSVEPKMTEGYIVACGPGKINPRSGVTFPMTVKSGYWVKFGSWAGTKVEIEGEELLIMTEADILGYKPSYIPDDFNTYTTKFHPFIVRSCFDTLKIRVDARKFGSNNEVLHFHEIGTYSSIQEAVADLPRLAKVYNLIYKAPEEV